jgi:hypothetical protein
MSLLGQDFDNAMKQLSKTLIDAQSVLANLHVAITRANALIDRINASLNAILKP